MNRIGVSGHRPSRLLIPTGDKGRRLFSEFCEIVINARYNEPDTVFNVGMAQGFDQFIARVCIKLKIPFNAYIPFKGFDSEWSSAARNQYEYLMKHAHETTIVCEGEFATWKYFKRNEAIIDKSDRMFVMLDEQNKGGTYRTSQVAKEKGMEVYNAFPAWREHLRRTLEKEGRCERLDYGGSI